MKKVRPREQVKEPPILNKENLIARAEVRIYASADRVWNALVNPEIIKRFIEEGKIRGLNPDSINYYAASYTGGSSRNHQDPLRGRED